MLVQLMVSKSYIWASFVEIQCNFLICNKILLKQIPNVRVVQSFDLETPALRMAHSIRVVLFIFIWRWNPPCTELLLKVYFLQEFPNIESQQLCCCGNLTVTTETATKHCGSVGPKCSLNSEELWVRLYFLKLQSFNSYL